MAITIRDPNGTIQAVRIGNDGAAKTLNIGATATSASVSAAIGGLSSDVGYHVNFGGTAATTDWYVPGNVLWFPVLSAGSVSCLSATGGDGTLFISEAV